MGIYDEIKSMVDAGAVCKVVPKGELSEYIENELSRREIKHESVFTIGKDSVCFIVPSKNSGDLLSIQLNNDRVSNFIPLKDLIDSCGRMGIKNTIMFDCNTPIISNIMQDKLIQSDILCSTDGERFYIHPECMYNPNGKDLGYFKLLLAAELIKEDSVFGFLPDPGSVLGDCVYESKYNEELVKTFLSQCFAKIPVTLGDYGVSDPVYFTNEKKGVFKNFIDDYGRLRKDLFFKYDDTLMPENRIRLKKEIIKMKNPTLAPTEDYQEMLSGVPLSDEFIPAYTPGMGKQILDDLYTDEIYPLIEAVNKKAGDIVAKAFPNINMADAKKLSEAMEMKISEIKKLLSGNSREMLPEIESFLNKDNPDKKTRNGILHKLSDCINNEKTFEYPSKVFGYEEKIVKYNSSEVKDSVENMKALADKLYGGKGEAERDE